MTTTQIAYWDLQEKKRSNLVNEDIKDRSQLETERSNRVREQLSAQELKEIERNHRVMEGVSRWNAFENTRNNVTNSIFGKSGILSLFK